jgi:hypothetical protein
MRGEKEKVISDNSEVEKLRAWDQVLKGYNNWRLREEAGSVKETEME